MFHGGFWVDDFVHHWGSEVALGIEVEPGEEGDYFVEHRKDDAEGKGGKEDIAELFQYLLFCKCCNEYEHHTEYKRT